MGAGHWVRALALATDTNVERAAEIFDREHRADDLAHLRARRENYIRYLRDRIDDEDWHGASDAANDLRELDVEIRMTGARR
jgi:hypothetical protein